MLALQGEGTLREVSEFVIYYDKLKMPYQLSP